MVHDEWNRHPKRNPARSTTSLPWGVKVLHDTAGMQPVSFSSCHSLSPNERFAATARVGPTYWDVQANAARSRRWKLWADVTGHPCKSTRGEPKQKNRKEQSIESKGDQETEKQKGKALQGQAKKCVCSPCSCHPLEAGGITLGWHLGRTWDVNRMSTAWSWVLYSMCSSTTMQTQCLQENDLQ